ncbi:MAG: Hsp70 family protein [Myxococcales bacterium]|nr:Hsp70 family protein [Myxococcales bacterium]
MARFIVGIDLGTTNSAVASVDLEAPGPDGPRIEPFSIVQAIAAGQFAPAPTLPSFLLVPNEHEVAPGEMSLPWVESPAYAAGVWARERGAELPHRVISSAKSWLSHPGVDRTAPLLPWRGAQVAEEEAPGETDGVRLSPVEASSMYLSHIRDAWNHAHPDAPLEAQEVLVTVPASFDAVARELTVVAAQQAGLASVTLLEEPQAAFYAWLAKNGDTWRQALAPDDAVLVCDVGGGTTDFSIIKVADDGQGALALERVAVGDHILLGGDNMDLALAHLCTQQLGEAGAKLSTLQHRALVFACRRAKEQLLSISPPEAVPVSVLGRGAKLIGSTLRTELRQDHVQHLVLDGFFPFVPKDARPQKRRTVGLRELGLPYAQDAAITRHLAEFLARHGQRPSAILFNGGVMRAALLRERVSQAVGLWDGRGDTPVLSGTDLDLAVALGAAYYGLVRRGRGIRIRGGTARAYYIGLEAAMPAIPGFPPPLKALCVAPFGMEEGGEPVKLPDEELGLVVGETAEFRLFASTERKDDAPGVLVDPDQAGLQELAPVHAELPAGPRALAGEPVAVSLESRVTELGTLELWCVAREGSDTGAGRWKLEFSVRHHD